MPNPFSKRAERDQPYAIYTAGDMVWHVLKTYKQPSSEAKDPYARWRVSAKSDATFGSFESGDTYAQEVQRYGWLVACTPKWAEHYGRAGMEYPTPEEYMSKVIGYQIFDSFDRAVSGLAPTASALWAQLGRLSDGRRDDRDVTYAIGRVYQNGDVSFD